ncbi:MAG: hypothetical protein JXR83_08655 [Deltaproteobacteria bacterium]|nr:hypothetical protein [Deltaproteobacteria bacterium]
MSCRRPILAQFGMIAALAGCSSACDDSSALNRLGREAGVSADAASDAGLVEDGGLVEDAGSFEDAGAPRRGPPWPVLLVHGFTGFNRLGPLEYFFRVIDTLAAEGELEVFAPALPPYNSVVERAPYLGRAIDLVLRDTSAAKVHIIAHSQGGLDARYAITVLGYDDRVATLTTVAAPHRGSPLGDYVLALPEDTLDPVAMLLAWLIGALDDPSAAPGGDDDWRNDMDAFARSVSPAAVAAYNAAHPDSPRVPIFSVAAVSNLQRARELCAASEWGALQRFDVVDPLLVPTAAALSGWNPFDRTPNDGIVPTASMIWGTFVGCIPADHFDEVGQIADYLPDLISGFDHLEFYRTLVARLRAWEQRVVEP